MSMVSNDSFTSRRDLPLSFRAPNPASGRLACPRVGIVDEEISRDHVALETDVEVLGRPHLARQRRVVVDQDVACNGRLAGREHPHKM